ncbi:hypothetical protein PtrSN002B_009499 [Pyrenophora tritici-repentis]|uniref:Uncharacterized protein n=2 Tax=Pyrenophora tritici-repentis TaxID=45151 RepID=A0A2W1HKZ8_9PLEO|nr:uncharacterized protein PTRG_06068 [Pyrenophora tritici-repentis Pt-1C-BFP]KAA8619202.1 hypothetical protein PtrV1_08631 [Pyrenophora tritici-repentis]EDU48988.1 predicted protein [Pyrenophora tritici-repentis Pt-1C-BFP]KAF7449673.1 hypothetical protein A1F99_067220 [Pyrenophora tritici-repentis]KAF7570206.1 hypothetical protein PtrM4_102080 [Pyrenophora tritici-repentis]KAG9383399.1 hypothetical protein A1F94_005310 [Pyrenophora tritici-repentis]
MDAADQAPGVGFVLKHYHKPIFPPNAPVKIFYLGIFTSLTLAQEAAQHALQCTLSKLIDQGYHGRYWKDVDLELRGLVTAYGETVVNGHLATQEYCLSEFHMETIEVWDPSWDAEVHRSSEDALFNSSCSESSKKMPEFKSHLVNLCSSPSRSWPWSTKPMVRLPVEKPKPVVWLPIAPKPTTPKSSPARYKPSSPTPIPKQPSVSTLEQTLQLSPTGVQYPEEQQGTWSGSRPPLPMSTSLPLPRLILPASQHEEELWPEWSRSRTS